ncbi:replication initiator A domain-containing protein [Clostridiaceae bacterium]|nr:replication initiator A domain-containing protein [Clostridiaceae bacterium]
MPDPAMLDYFYGDEAEQYTFYRIPKVLFTDPGYRRISSDAKILYGLMLDRMGLSIRNGWLDDLNRVFIYFTLEDALEYLCCGHTKAVSLFGELDKNGLIERKKQGQGKPTIIYVKNFIRKPEIQTSEKRKSKVPQTGSQDFQKTATNNTERNKTELSDTDLSIYPVREQVESHEPTIDDRIDRIRAYRRLIKENIEYDITRDRLGYDAEILDEILDIMVDTVCGTKPMVRISGQDFPTEVVRSRLLKLNSEHIKYVVDCLKSNTTKVRNIRSYLLTSLYNAPTTISSYYTALVNHDLYGGG